MTATVLYLSPTGEAVVEFVEGAQKVTFRYQTDGTLASLRPQVLRTTAQLAKVKDLTEGAVLDLTPDAIVPPVEPTQRELARRAFALQVQTLKKLQTGLALEVVPQQDVDDLTVAVRAAFQPGFEDSL